MDKKKYRLFLISGGTLVLFFLSIILYISLRPAYLMPDTTGWNTGDIFFSVGDSWESAAVRTLTGAKYFELADSTPSHCGFVVRDSNKVFLVHESTVAKRIVAETPEEYLKNNGSYCLYAVKPNADTDSAALLRTLNSLIDNRIPFDFEFNHADSKSLYCTEMVIRVFELNGNFSFSALKDQNYIYPEDLLKMCVNQ